jgi:hypothetical protein
MRIVPISDDEFALKFYSESGANVVSLVQLKGPDADEMTRQFYTHLRALFDITGLQIG